MLEQAKYLATRELVIGMVEQVDGIMPICDLTQIEQRSQMPCVHESFP
jgi:hypothetical protein